MKEFDEIAAEWEDYRQEPSPALSFFLPLVRKADRVLDAGCGNGRNLIPISRHCREAVGVDSSGRMLENAEKRLQADGAANTRLLKASITRLPFPNGEFDKVACLAVLHHLKTPAERLAALQEFARLLAPCGVLFLTVWNKQQAKFRGLEGDDAQIAWKAGREQAPVMRFYHFFSEGELLGPLKTAGFTAKELFFEKDGTRVQAEGASNLCAIAVKNSPPAKKPTNK